MSKTITVPDIGAQPIEITINQTSYTLTPGATATVPDEVAALLERIVAARPTPAADGWKKRPATIEDVEAIAGGGSYTVHLHDGDTATMEEDWDDLLAAYSAGKQLTALIDDGSGGGFVACTFAGVGLVDGEVAAIQFGTCHNANASIVSVAATVTDGLVIIYTREIPTDNSAVTLYGNIDETTGSISLTEDDGTAMTARSLYLQAAERPVAAQLTLSGGPVYVMIYCWLTIQLLSGDGYADYQVSLLAPDGKVYTSEHLSDNDPVVLPPQS